MKLTDVKVVWVDGTTTTFCHVRIEENDSRYMVLRRIYGGSPIVINREYFKYAIEEEVGE